MRLKSKPVKYTLFATALFMAGVGYSALALNHPHESETVTKTETKSVWPYFGSKSADPSQKSNIELEGDMEIDMEEFADRLSRRAERRASKFEKDVERAQKRYNLEDIGEIESADDIRRAARTLEKFIGESGVISNFADMMLGLAEDFDIETDDEGMSVKFDGKNIGHIKREGGQGVDFGSFGKGMSVNRETFTKNGKTKTRIIIEVDGDAPFDVEINPKEDD